MDTTFIALGSERYVQLTTFRKTGEAVPTPVWVATDGDALVVVTVRDSGKVKRARHTPRVELRPSSISGKVRDDAPTVSGTVEIVEGEAQMASGLSALRRKYGFQFRLAFGSEKKPRKDRAERVILRITAA